MIIKIVIIKKVYLPIFIFENVHCPYIIQNYSSFDQLPIIYNTLYRLDIIFFYNILNVIVIFLEVILIWLSSGSLHQNIHSLNRYRLCYFDGTAITFNAYYTLGKGALRGWLNSKTIKYLNINIYLIYLGFKLGHKPIEMYKLPIYNV